MRSAVGRAAITVAISSAVALAAGSALAFASTPPAHRATLPTVIVTGTPVASVKAEPHPEIMAAMHALEEAKHLSSAPPPILAAIGSRPSNRSMSNAPSQRSDPIRAVVNDR